MIRILDGGRKLFDLKSLALDKRQLEDLKRMVEGGEGVVLATGPTGSGKTTTLYALLQHLNSPEIKIITVEDPVENQLDGATQISMNAKSPSTSKDAKSSAKEKSTRETSEELNEALEDSFPASDPPSMTQPKGAKGDEDAKPRKSK